MSDDVSAVIDRRYSIVMRRYPRINQAPAALPLFCLAPHGVFRASRITPRAVSSYLAFSPLPALFSKNRRYVFCDTFRQRPLSRMLPAYFTRHAAVWCSDFPPATSKAFGVTSDHLPSAENLARRIRIWKPGMGRFDIECQGRARSPLRAAFVGPSACTECPPYRFW